MSTEEGTSAVYILPNNHLVASAFFRQAPLSTTTDPGRGHCPLGTSASEDGRSQHSGEWSFDYVPTVEVVFLLLLMSRQNLFSIGSEFGKR